MLYSFLDLVSAIFVLENLCKEWEQVDIEVFSDSFSVFSVVELSVASTSLSACFVVTMSLCVLCSSIFIIFSSNNFVITQNF